MSRPIISMAATLAILIVSLMLFATTLAPACTAKTITVTAPGSIQAAIDSATAGDTIQVNSGTYKENVVVNKMLTLIGIDNGSGMPVVDGSGSTAINITANNVTVQGFTATGAIDSCAGICIGADNATVRNNNASGNAYGIYVSGCNNSVIACNTANYNKKSGIDITSSSNISLTGNTCNFNDDESRYAGILVGSSSNNKLTGNTANNNTGHGIALFCSNNILAGNNANNNTGNGIALAGSNNTLTGNTFNGNARYGISAFVKSNSITGNIVSYNAMDGIYLGGLDNTLTGNTASYNARNGIILERSSNSKLTGNTANYNARCGIQVSNSSGNVIWQNCFSNAVITDSTGAGTNAWNSTTMQQYTYNGKMCMNYTGNYWSDYTGMDSDGDGIGDTPYMTGAGNTDYYPMIQATGSVATATPTPGFPILLCITALAVIACIARAHGKR